MPGSRTFPTFLILASILLAGSATATTLRVPADHPNIQAAVDAAQPGDTIRIAPGTYVEQVTIGKDLTVVGSGAGVTAIRAPATLVPGAIGDTSIVEVGAGAAATIRSLTVRGPGSGTCDAGALVNGILALPGSRLHVRFVAVSHIHDTPLANCERSGNAILTHDAEAMIEASYFKDYQAAAIVIVGGIGTITNNVVIGPGKSQATTTGGIELVAGAVGTVAYNVVSGNDCGNADFGCGPDFFNEFQQAGITGGGAGTIITHNVLVRNQVGIYVGEEAELTDNLLVGNTYFGLALQDGTFTVHDHHIVGGQGGVSVIAAFADTDVTLDRVRIFGTSGAKVQTFECCGFGATVHGQ